MAVIKVGDIYWADIDFTDKSENKLRPRGGLKCRQ
jgi:hypothetical protein